MKDKKKYLEDLVSEEVEFTDNVRDAIYIITVDGKNHFVDGGFYQGIRSIDHNELKFDGYSWEDIIEMGTILVPETRSAIGTKHKDFARRLGFKCLAEDDNHIVGWGN